MTNHLLAPAHHVKERLSSVIMVPAPHAVDDRWRRWSRDWPVRELAPAPAGSGLKAVRGDAGLPFVGHTLDYIRFGSDFSRERYDRLGSVSWMGAFGTKMVVIAGPDATREAFTSEAKAFSQDGWSFLIDAFFHRGLMLMSFDEHLMHRRIMQEAFTRPRLTGYVEQVTPCVRSAVPAWPVGPSVRIYPLLKELTLDIATDVFMGGRGKDESDAVNKAFVATVRAASSLCVLRFREPDSALVCKGGAFWRTTSSGICRPREPVKRRICSLLSVKPRPKTGSGFPTRMW